VEAIILAGGRGERLGEAAQGRPKPLVLIAGRPLLAYAVSRLAAAGVERVIVACAAGTEELFLRELADCGPEIVTVPEPEPLGRGGGIKLAARERRERGPVFALNGDELIDVDFRALLERHRERKPAATITLTALRSAVGVVDLDDDDVVTGFREAPELPYWVNVGNYVLDDEALDLFPDRGDHETTAFPLLAAQRRLYGFRHTGRWLTVNTPKELRVAEEYLSAHPDWLSVR
jgi:NDP-sugar pyrophosphorylase family protein